MHLFLHQRRRFSLIVCIAIMLNLFTPALGQAVALLSMDPLAGELCRAATGKNGDGNQPQLPGAGHHLKHCAWCASLAGAPPPARVTVQLPAAVAATGQVTHYRAPPPPQPWSDAHPRAPPRTA
jgi:Protein of unknown function (DUF2946)